MGWSFPWGNVFRDNYGSIPDLITVYTIGISNKQKYDTRFQNKLNNFSQLG